MIARLRGEVIEKGMQSITLDVQGVGYAVAVVDEHGYSIHQTIDLHTYFHWNQENGPLLYGFNDALSKTVFAHILSCSGCGPKIALAILAHMPPQDFLRAIAVGNGSALSEVNGIGTKKAELMIMQLKDKVAKIAPGNAVDKHDTLSKIRQVHEALAALRYKPAEITSALEYLNKQVVIETSPIDELLKKGLSFLAKRL